MLEEDHSDKTATNTKVAS